MKGFWHFFGNGGRFFSHKDKVLLLYEGYFAIGAYPEPKPGIAFWYGANDQPAA
ncbi:hypothetical protein [Solidesulfovibrio fructosivorans]|uniref:hypothetical protein n=1 Tax=Solidesulfovibrio fructosivorans TaxID=878 RepID=UPI00130524E7|nr:hypothetical protein [Solidesulfovibrio fructosivorans]